MLSQLIPSRRASTEHGYGPAADFWYAPVSRAVSAGVSVTPESAMGYSAVWAATRIICGTAGRLPLNLYRTTGARGKAVAADDPRNYLVDHEPNGHMIPMLFKSQAVAQQVNAGNAYAEIQRDKRGAPIALWPIHQTRVTPLVVASTNELFYRVKNNDHTTVDIEAADILHFPSMMTEDGIVGKGVIQHARETIGTGLAAVRAAGSTFGAGGLPRVVVESPKKWSSESRQNFRKEWKEIYGGPDGDKVGVMDEGSKLHVLGVNYRDLQFLELQQYTAEDVGRWYLVPQHKIGLLNHATFSNIEHQAQEFISDGMLQWLVIIEEELNRKLLTREEKLSGMFFWFKVSEYIRGDTVARGQYHQLLVNSGIETRNEARIDEEMNPVDGGDTFLVQGAMVALDEDGKPAGGFGGEGATATNETDGDAMPTDAESAAVTGDVQATALNGSQIVALVDIATRLAAEQLPPEGTRAMLQAAFPLMAQSLIDTMVDELDKFEPKQPEQPQGGGFPPGNQSPKEPAAEPEEEQPEDDATATAREVVRIVLQDTLARMIRKETTAARRAAHKPKEFLKWIDEFYPKHQEQLAEALGFAEQAAGKLSLVFSAVSASERLIEQSRSALLTASETTADKLPEAIEQLATAWETHRAAEIVREFFERAEQ